MTDTILVVYVFPTVKPSFFKNAEAFVRSYLEYPAGAGHDLMVVVNNDVLEIPAVVYKIFSEVKCRIMAHSNIGFDIKAYLDVLKSTGYTYYCFLGASTRILTQDWLRKFLDCAQNAPKCGVVGSSGSFGTTAITHKTYNPHIRSTNFFIKGSLLRSIKV